MKISVLVVILISLLVCSTVLEIAQAISNPPTSTTASPPVPVKALPPVRSIPGVPNSCVPKCTLRCSRNPRALCKKLCLSCCSICKCVPVGPFGDKNTCPCYRDRVTSSGKPKCP